MAGDKFTFTDQLGIFFFFPYLLEYQLLISFPYLFENKASVHSLATAQAHTSSKRGGVPVKGTSPATLWHPQPPYGVPSHPTVSPCPGAGMSPCIPSQGCLEPVTDSDAVSPSVGTRFCHQALLATWQPTWNEPLALVCVGRSPRLIFKGFI